MRHLSDICRCQAIPGGRHELYFAIILCESTHFFLDNTPQTCLNIHVSGVCTETPISMLISAPDTLLGSGVVPNVWPCLGPPQNYEIRSRRDHIWPAGHGIQRSPDTVRQDTTQWQQALSRGTWIGTRYAGDVGQCAPTPHTQVVLTHRLCQKHQYRQKHHAKTPIYRDSFEVDASYFCVIIKLIQGSANPLWSCRIIDLFFYSFYWTPLIGGFFCPYIAVSTRLTHYQSML